MDYGVTATPIEESNKIANDLIAYCGFDTNAMFEIWKHLMGHIETTVV